MTEEKMKRLGYGSIEEFEAEKARIEFTRLVCEHTWEYTLTGKSRLCLKCRKVEKVNHLAEKWI